MPRSEGFPSIDDPRLGAIAAVLRRIVLPAFPNDAPAAQPFDGIPVTTSVDNALLSAARLHGCVWPLVQAGPAANPLTAAMKSDISAHAAAISAQMRELNALLSPHARIIWLKGAANLADQGLEPQPWRQMADLDILVARDAIVPVARLLGEAGYRTDGRPYDERLNPHLPAFGHADKPALVEVHSRLLRYREGDLLDPLSVLGGAVARDTGVGMFLVPSREDRIVHLIAHAQIGSHRHARRQFAMRDALELAYLTGSDKDVIARVLSRFEETGRGAACIAYLAMASLVMDRPFIAPERWTPAALRWTLAVIDGWRNPGRQSAWVILDWIAEIGRTLGSPEKFSAIARLVTNPALRRDALANMSKHLKGD